MNGYIDNQDDGVFANWQYGRVGNLKKNGCGIIATYNVLLNHKKISNTSSDYGNTMELAKIVKDYEYAFGTILGGIAGTNPLHIAPYLISRGLNVTTYGYSSQSLFESRCNAMSTSRIAIMCYFWRTSNGKIGMHYITIKKNSSGSLYLINEVESDPYSDIRNFTSQNTFVYGWMV